MCKSIVYLSIPLSSLFSITSIIDFFTRMHCEYTGDELKYNSSLTNKNDNIGFS